MTIGSELNFVIPIDRLATALSWAYVLERALKIAAVVRFFGRRTPPAPETWPTITLLQPITRGAGNLQAVLGARSHLQYPAHLQFLFMCDASDSASQAICLRWLAQHPDLDATMMQVESARGIASKTTKLQAGLSHAVRDVVCCVDDDIILRSDSLRTMIPYLYGPGAGAAFGLACYTDWTNLPSSLMSGFVNANAFLIYIPAIYLTEPFTITGHIFAVRRDLLEAIGGFAGLENNIGDDHTLAEKVRKAGLQPVLTPMIYDVENHFNTISEYAAQMKRWFVFPRQALMPLMTSKEQAITLALSAGNVIPGLLALIAVFTRRRGAIVALAQSMVAFNVAYSLCELLYLKRHTPLWRRPLVAISALMAPLQVVAAFLSNNNIEWRGRHLHIMPGGDFTEVE